MSRAMIRTVVLLTLGAVPGTVRASAQEVPIRTVPVASGDQFLLLPSESIAMGGVRVALQDALADPWVNPAKGAAVSETAFLASPTFYTISNQGGAGRTLPIAAMHAGTRFFAGGAAALQQIENESAGGPFFARPTIEPWPAPRRLSDASARNLYASAYMGARLGAVWSIGLGLGASALDAMDGVDLLYANADRIEQSGGTKDVRIGMYRAGPRDRIGVTALHSRVSMRHDVTYSQWFWTEPVIAPPPEPRIEVSEDKTRTWGAHVEWERDLRAPGWSVGASATVNRKAHPKIPNYDIQNIPRDPGTTWAYEVAVGFARRSGPALYALDIAFQPIWSETWQEADAQDVANSGGSLSLGDRSIVNDFFFTNVALRTGVAYDVGRATVQGGLSLRSYDYALEQVNRVLSAYREQDESWMEWSPTFGVVFRFSELDLRYSGRLTTGTGRPGTAADGRGVAFAEASSQADFILAPQGPLTLQDVNVVTHQLSVRMPVR